MMLKKRYSLDILPGSVPLLIRASQKDNASMLILTLWSRDGVLEIPASASVSLRGKNLNGEICEENGTLSVTNGVPMVNVNISRGMTSALGLNPFELVITAEGYSLCSSTFYLDVR